MKTNHQWRTEPDHQQVEFVLTVSDQGTVSCVEVNPRETYDLEEVRGILSKLL